MAGVQPNAALRPWGARMTPMLDRALGALIGVAVGDAMGMPGQTLPRDRILSAYGRITGFVAPMPGHPVSTGLVAGMVTDDTEQTLLLAQRLIADRGGFDEAMWASDLLRWEAQVRARGLHDLLGPSTKAALVALLAGVPVTETGRRGTTNGAAMRIAPVGIATQPLALTLVDRVEAVSRVTHATGEALAAAAAVAMMISQGVAGSSFEAGLPLALDAARLANRRGAQSGEVDVAGRITLALSLAAQGEIALADGIGTSVQSAQSVAAAFGVVRLAGGDPWRAAVVAANIGDDTDTIGAIACAMAGACAGLTAFPKGRVAEVTRINRLDLSVLAEGLLTLRSAAA
jgi:ADP-ribosylglycohydrolase